MKLEICIPDIWPQESVSQIFDLGLSLDFMLSRKLS